MDTRIKIIDAAEAARIAGEGATVVSGTFDPLTAATAERLAGFKENGGRLLVVITTPPDAILSARGRAELVAGLACVDYVCEQAPGLTPAVALEDEHRAGLAQLIRHVHARQHAAASKASR